MRGVSGSRYGLMASATNNPAQNRFGTQAKKITGGGLHTGRFILFTVLHVYFLSV